MEFFLQRIPFNLAGSTETKCGGADSDQRSRHRDMQVYCSPLLSTAGDKICSGPAKQTPLLSTEGGLICSDPEKQTQGHAGVLLTFAEYRRRSDLDRRRSGDASLDARDRAALGSACMECTRHCLTSFKPRYKNLLQHIAALQYSLAKELWPSECSTLHATCHFRLYFPQQ